MSIYVSKRFAGIVCPCAMPAIQTADISHHFAVTHPGICTVGHAQTTANWIGPASGAEWNTAADWSTARVPGSGTNVVIGPGTNVSYNLPMAASTFGMLTNKGVLNINTNGFNNTGILMLNPGGTGQVLVINANGVVTITGNLAFCSNSVV